jgi:hypothetical protein
MVLCSTCMSTKCYRSTSVTRLASRKQMQIQTWCIDSQNWFVDNNMKHSSTSLPPSLTTIDCGEKIGDNGENICRFFWLCLHRLELDPHTLRLATGEDKFFIC